MIYLRLAGGLGNQLFQLACALKSRVEPTEPIALVTNALGSYKTARQPDIKLVLDLSSLHVTVDNLPPSVICVALATRLPRLLPFFGLNDRNFDPVVTRRSMASKAFPKLADGYFQTQWTWSTMSDVLSQMSRSMTAPPATTQDSECCVIHVRGTDFLHSSNHNLISEDYYERALATIRSVRLITRASVITDDPTYARTLLQSTLAANPDVAVEFAESKGSLLSDFSALRDAGARVIPNSTFSWWAAALDQRRSLTVSPDIFVKATKRQPALPWERTIFAA